MNSLLQNRGEDIESNSPVLRAEVDLTLKYFLIFLVLGFTSAVYFSYLLALFSAMPALPALWKVAGIGLVFFLVILFQSFFIQSTYFNLILTLIHTVGLFGFFYRPFSTWFIGAALLFFLFYAFGLMTARRELNTSLKINFWRFSSTLSMALITGMALLLALLYVGLYQRIGGISYQVYKFSLTSFPGLEYVVPNFTPETKADTFFENYAREALKNDPRYERPTAAERDQLAAQAGAALKQQAEDFSATPVQRDTSILEYGYQLIQRFFTYLKDRGLGSLAIAAIIAVIYFAIKGVMFFLRWPLLFAASILYFLLLSVGIISIQTEQRQKEVAVIH